VSKDKLQPEGLTEAWPTVATSLQCPDYVSGSVRHYAPDSARQSERWDPPSPLARFDGVC